MGLISSNHHFESRCEEDPGDETVEGYKDLGSIFPLCTNPGHVSLCHFSLQITYQNP